MHAFNIDIDNDTVARAGFGTTSPVGRLPSPGDIIDNKALFLKRRPSLAESFLQSWNRAYRAGSDSI